MSDVVVKIKKELDAFNQKKVELVKELRKEFPSLFKDLFDKSKRINSIRWNQYTPYFNDGDECTFRVSLDYIYINGEHIEDVKWYDWRFDRERYVGELVGNTDVDFEECRIVKEFKELLQSIPDEFYKDLFGDHVQVTITRNGTIEVEEYDHD